MMQYVKLYLVNGLLLWINKTRDGPGAHNTGGNNKGENVDPGFLMQFLFTHDSISKVTVFQAEFQNFAFKIHPHSSESGQLGAGE